MCQSALHAIKVDPQAVCDVVFVHGLDGHPIKTWNLGDDGSWATWFEEDHPEWNTWTLEYSAPSTEWKTGNAMPLSKRSINVLAELESNEFGTRPLYFICHSLGGLLVKRLLQQAQNIINYRRFLDQTQGVVFFSTPHLGSAVADKVVRYIDLIYRGTVALEELQSHTSDLFDLAGWYRENSFHHHVQSLVFYETKKTQKLGLKDLVVDQYSAEPAIPFCTPIPIDADHFDICVPTGKDDKRYRLTRKFIERRLWLDTFAASVIPPGEPYYLMGDAVAGLFMESAHAGQIPFQGSADDAGGMRTTVVNPGPTVQVMTRIHWPDRSVAELDLSGSTGTTAAVTGGVVGGIQGAPAGEDLGEMFPVHLATNAATGITLNAGPTADRPGFMRLQTTVNSLTFAQYVESQLPKNLEED